MMKTNNTNGAVIAPLGIYVHIPFCVRKCKYCDFVSFGGKTHEEQLDYVNVLCAEITAKAKTCSNRYYVDTIFFGGGTPSILNAEDLIKILNTIKNNFTVQNNAEISFEANPGTINIEKLSKLKDAGFNRISIGVQSFNNDVLKAIGRIHNAKEAEEAATLAKSLDFNLNIDLMFGLPKQDLSIFKETFDKALSLKPNHISFYSLQLEEGTELFKEYKYGDLNLPTWDENREMYHYACDSLNNAGYEHYEISNAAKPGYRCKHNIKYWSLDEYLGFGLSAHSFVDGKRTDDENPDLKGDFIFTKLRLIEGFDKKEYEDRFGISFEDEFNDSYKSLLEEGLLKEENYIISFTKKGLDYTNPVMQRLLEKLMR
ncbi:MAG: radical SAM family heme chaperone HemW [Bacillota bacterium]|nr:radical SAM family heme chaperone HemW [Bacillota bacterium]